MTDSLKVLDYLKQNLIRDFGLKEEAIQSFSGSDSDVDDVGDVAEVDVDVATRDGAGAARAVQIRRTGIHKGSATPAGLKPEQAAAMHSGGIAVATKDPIGPLT